MIGNNTIMLYGNVIPNADVIEDISRTLFPDFTIILYVSDVGVVRTEKF